MTRGKVSLGGSQLDAVTDAYTNPPILVSLKSRKVTKFAVASPLSEILVLLLFGSFASAYPSIKVDAPLSEILTFTIGRNI